MRRSLKAVGARWCFVGCDVPGVVVGSEVVANARVRCAGAAIDFETVLILIDEQCIRHRDRGIDAAMVR